MVNNPPANARDTALIPGLGRPPGEGNGNSPQHSCLGNTMDRGSWWTAVHGVAKSWTQLRLNSSSSGKFESLVDLSFVL